MENHLSWESYQAQIQNLKALEYNYDEKIFHDALDKRGWNIDDYHANLAYEPQGQPVPGGPFEEVKDAIQLYQFPDPRLITAVFDPKSSLPGRNMLLLAKFAGFKFEFGVRVSAVIDELQRDENGQMQKVWGYSYRTLKGHFEIGEITFLVRKNIETGQITFEIKAYSKPDRIPNLFYRTGFKIFGRSLQKYFASSSIRRLKALATNAPGAITGPQG